MEPTKTKCLIVDDEPLAIKLIRTHLDKFGNLEVAGECRSAAEAAEFLRNNKIDLMFLDINMPEMTGLEFMKTIADPPYVIITTAFREYAVEGYDLDVVDFLLKPVAAERFKKAINRFISRTQPSHSKEGDEVRYENHVRIKEGRNVFEIPREEILYFEAFGENINVITLKESHMMKGSIEKYDKELPTDCFLRIHKSYIVNIKKILGFSAMHVMLKSRQLPIGIAYADKVMKVLNRK